MINEELKNKLLEEKNLLTEELASVGHKVADGDFEAKMEGGNEPDENELADRMENFEERNSMINTLEARLQEVNIALVSIESGTFGKCSVCNAPIEEDRLSANPAASTCKAHMNQN